MRQLLHTPSYANGQWAQPGSAYSANPDLAQMLMGLWMPSMGATGLTLLDLSGRRNDGVLTNMDVSTDWVIGPENGYVLTTQSGEHVTGSIPNIQNECTIISRFKTGPSDTARPFNIADVTTSDQYFALDANVDNFFTFWYRNGGVQRIVYSGILPTANTWYEMAGVAGPGNLRKLYLNGILVDSAIDSGYPSVINGFGIGDLVRSAPLGSICDVASASVYNRALAPSEIQHLYQDPFALVRRRARVYALAAAAGGLLVHPGMTGGMKEMAGGMRG